MGVRIRSEKVRHDVPALRQLRPSGVRTLVYLLQGRQAVGVQCVLPGRVRRSDLCSNTSDQAALVCNAGAFVRGGPVRDPSRGVDALVNAGDVVGIYFALNQKTVGGEARVLSVGLGWAGAESILMRLAPLWIGARQLEFSWEYIQMSIEANFSLLRLIALTTLVWLYTHSRKEHTALSSIKMSAYAIILHFAFPIAVSFLQLQLHVGSWYLVVASGLFSALMAYVANHLNALYSVERQTKAK